MKRWLESADVFHVRFFQEGYVLGSCCWSAWDQCASVAGFCLFTKELQPAKRRGFFQLALLCFGYARAGLSDCLAKSAFCDLRNQFAVCGCCCYGVHAGTRNRQPGWRLVIVALSKTGNLSFCGSGAWRGGLWALLVAYFSLGVSVYGRGKFGFCDPL